MSDLSLQSRVSVLESEKNTIQEIIKKHAEEIEGLKKFKWQALALISVLGPFVSKFLEKMFK